MEFVYALPQSDFPNDQDEEEVPSDLIDEPNREVSNRFCLHCICS